MYQNLDVGAPKKGRAFGRNCLVLPLAPTSSLRQEHYMKPTVTSFARSSDGRSLYKGAHVKADGRAVTLYGYVPPDATPVNEGLQAEPTAPELRWHPLRGEWNIYAGARQNRTFKPGAATNPLAAAIAGGPPTEIPFADFELAIFENRFPSLRGDTSPVEPAEAFENKPAHGHCDVVVYSPEPKGSLASLSQDRRVLLVNAWIDRYQDLFTKGFDTVLPFENRGDAVGVTLHHPHGQIYAFGKTPPVQAAAARAFDAGYDLAAKLDAWRTAYEVTSVGGITAFAPPFARFPYEVWLAPYTPRRGPWEVTLEEIDGFASLLGDVTARYDRLFGRECPFMLSLHAAPQSAGAGFHFTAQFYPLLRSADKVKYLASVEQSTGVFTVDILPEAAAIALREA